MTTLTAEQIQDLREEFIDFKINEMSREEMADWIRTVYLDELERCTVDELEYESPIPPNATAAEQEADHSTKAVQKQEVFCSRREELGRLQLLPKGAVVRDLL